MVDISKIYMADSKETKTDLNSNVKINYTSTDLVKYVGNNTYFLNKLIDKTFLTRLKENIVMIKESR